MKRKFKVEDKVKNVKNLSGFEKDDKYVGKIGIIIYDDHTSTPYEVKFNNGKVIWFKDSELELVKEENQEYVTRAEFEENKKSINKSIEENKETGRERYNEEYWYINDYGEKCSSYECFMTADDYRYKTGNYYLTYEECLRAKEIQDILNKYSYRFSTEELENSNVKKYEIFADIDDKKIKIHQMYYCLSTNFKFNNQEDCQKAIDEIGYDDYLQYCVRGNIK